MGQGSLGEAGRREGGSWAATSAPPSASAKALMNGTAAAPIPALRKNRRLESSRASASIPQCSLLAIFTSFSSVRNSGRLMQIPGIGILLGLALWTAGGRSAERRDLW